MSKRDVGIVVCLVFAILVRFLCDSFDACMSFCAAAMVISFTEDK